MKIILCLILSILSFYSLADCENIYYKNTAPILEQKTTMSCNIFFVVQFDKNLQIPLTSSEHLTSENVISAKNIPRKNTFHNDESGIDSSDIKSYSKTGYDRGHMTPDADAPDVKSQYESFNIINMTPQTPKLNRVIWRLIENKVRKDALNFGSVYIVTGAIAANDSKRLDTIAIPQYLFKAEYIPSSGKAIVYVAPNDNSKSFNIMQLTDFKLKYNINPFPAIIE